MDKPPLKLLDRVRYRIRLKGYSIRTEQAYTGWIRRFIIFHNKRHPRDMGKAEMEAFLSNLAINRQVAASGKLLPQLRTRLSIHCFFYIEMYLKSNFRILLTLFGRSVRFVCLLCYLTRRRSISFR